MDPDEHFEDTMIDSLEKIYKKNREKFDKLKEQFNKETSMYSFSSMWGKNSTYREIVSMGTAVVPLMVEDMRQERGKWAWFGAIGEITGAKIDIPEESWGKFGDITDIYLRWADDCGY
jgi:uncharacterized membrane protein